MTKISLANLTFNYTELETSFTAVKDINLAIRAGEFVSIVGPSGCGKSTLLSIMAGLNFPTDGAAILDGEKIIGTGVDRGVVFQHYSLFPWMSAKKNILFGLQQVLGKKSKKELVEIADEYLQLVGLKDFADMYPSQLSGGMQQRVAIARAFAINSPILLMDEPFGAVDAKNRVILQDILLRLWENQGEKKTVILVTHDIDEAILLSDRIVVLSAGPGRIKEDLPISFARPRERASLMRNPEYGELRAKLINLFYDDLIQKIGPEVVL